jgi:hypothetical protein
VKLEKRFSHGLQFLVTYTRSKSIDTASNNASEGELGGLTTLQDPNKMRLERSLSSFDIPDVLQLAYTYELPIGRGKAFAGKGNSVVNAFIGGWNTTGIWRLNDGRPELLALSGGQSLPTYGGQRPDLTGTLTCTTGSWNTRLNDYFTNPQVVKLPAARTSERKPVDFQGIPPREAPGGRPHRIPLRNLQCFQSPAIRRTEYDSQFRQFRSDHFASERTARGTGRLEAVLVRGL